MIDTTSFQSHSFPLFTGEPTTILLGPEYDTGSTETFYKELYDLTRKFNFAHCTGEFSFQALDEQAKVVLDVIENPKVDINAYKKDVGSLFFPFFFHAFANAPGSVFSAYYNNPRTDFSRNGFVEGLPNKTGLLEFMIVIDMRRSENFPDIKIPDLRESYRLACSIPEQPIVVFDSQAQRYQLLRPGRLNPHAEDVGAFIGQRSARSVMRQIEETNLALAEMADAMGRLTFPGITTHGEESIAELLKKKFNTIQKWLSVHYPN